MPIELKIDVVERGIPPVARGDLSAHNVAIQRGGSDALRAMRAEAVRRVRERRAIKASTLRDAMTLDFPKIGFFGGIGSEPEWVMRVSGSPMPVAAYPHRQVRAGVLVQIRTGSSTTIHHAFKAVMRNKHEGVFKRTGRFKWREGKRGRSVRREIIEELFTTRVTDVFRDQGFIDDLLEHAAAIFERTYNRNMANARQA